MTKLSEARPPHFGLTESAAPSTPAAGEFEIYAATDGTLHSLNDAGTDVDHSAAISNVYTEENYTQITAATTNITATTEGTADVIITAGAVSFDGSTVGIIEFQFTAVDVPGNQSLLFVIEDGGSSIGRPVQLTDPDPTNLMRVPVHASYRLTPSNASHTYAIAAYVTSGTGVVRAGAGGSGNYSPGWIKVWKKTA